VPAPAGTVTSGPQAGTGMTLKRPPRPSFVPSTFTPETRCPRWLRQVLRLIIESPHTVVHLDDLSAAVGRSKYFLVREFTRVYGCSPIRLHRAFRLEEAARRLSGGASASAVAADLGFADQSHLSRLFSATFSEPPATYSRTHSGVPSGTAGAAH